MTKTYRIGVAGLTHDHVWGNLENLATSEKGQLAAVADPNQPLLDRVTQQYGCAAYADYREMVDRESLDALYVFCDNAQGAEVGVWAAPQGLHVLVEKPMAATLEGAERLIAAVDRCGSSGWRAADDQLACRVADDDRPAADQRGMKGRISKWLGEQNQLQEPTKSLGRGYFAATTGQSNSTAVQEYLERQAEHHGYSDRIRPPVFVQQFERTDETRRILETDHAVTVLRYHVVLATWWRRGVFGPSTAEAVCNCWRALQSDCRMVIDKVSFLPDHVHVALALHPSKSPAEIVVAMMNAGQEKTWEAFADDVVRAGVERLWQASAYIGSFGDLTSNAISAYLERWERL